MSTEHFKAYNDAQARAIFMQFEKLLKPFMAEATPDWLLHHMEIRRQHNHLNYTEEVQIRLVLRPIGEARVVDQDADLRTGHRRLEDRSHG